ncbi:MAG: phytase [Gemmatimonadota bacterium]
MKRKADRFPLLVAVLLFFPVLACGQKEDNASGGATGGSGSVNGELESTLPSSSSGIVTISERWLSAWDTTANLDSPAVWVGEGEVWVVTTAKGTHDLWVHDASTGALLRRVGKPGSGPGEFNYPNGIAIVGDLLLVVERDNHRVQALALPGFEPLGDFGADVLERPYGIAVSETPDALSVYVTDDYGNDIDLPDGVAPTGDFTRRVKQFRVSLAPEGVEAELVRTFGEAEGPGAILVAESIQVDEEQSLLLIADEFNLELEAYSLDGSYLGRTVGSDLYDHGDPEGIMLYRCGSSGYWILTDQGFARTVFHVLDRVTMEHLGSFSGEVTANTDGIWLTQASVPGLGQGALFALHDDGGLAAFAWDDIGQALGLQTGCSPSL